MSNKFDIHASDVPAIRIADAVGRRVNKNILFVVMGGLGDRICAEPTLRFALNRFPDCDFSLRCETPEVFAHLKFKKIYGHGETPEPGEYLQLPTYPSSLRLANQFFNANLMHSVDCASITALRCQLPIRYRPPQLRPKPPTQDLSGLVDSGNVLIHIGATWPSRSLPMSFWDAVILECARVGRTPVVFGNGDRRRLAYKAAALDVREELSLNDYLWVMRNAPAVVTNDSSPIHAAAAGDARIAFIPTSRHPDFLFHHRFINGDGEIGDGEIVFGWRMAAFHGKPMWKAFHQLPNTLDDWPANEVPEGSEMGDYLPKPEAIFRWLNSEEA